MIQPLLTGVVSGEEVTRGTCWVGPFSPDGTGTLYISALAFFFSPGKFLSL